jgi:NADH-quinone oxidoreductase subunit F
VLFGMLVAGFAVGAETGLLYLRAEYPEAIEAVRRAVGELREHGLTGEGICGSDFTFDFKVVPGAGSYVCGEETALLASMEGRRPEVGVRPPYPTAAGLFGRPTVVNNVETLAALPYLLEVGGDAFAALGTPASSGSKLVTLDGGFVRPGLYEVAMGTPLAEVVHRLGGGFARPTKGLHVGGPLGGLLPVGEIDRLEVSFESFQERGFSLGHGSVVAIPEKVPILRYLAHLFDFVARESCGKCVPCRIGSVRGREMVERAAAGEGRIDRQLFDDLLEALEGGSLCALGGGLPLPVRNAVEHFGEELRVDFTAGGLGG